MFGVVYNLIMKRITDMAVELFTKSKSTEATLRHGVKLVTTRTGDGRYCCVDVAGAQSDERVVGDFVSEVLGGVLRKFVGGSGKVLVVGLGNNRFVADALGHKVCEMVVADGRFMTFTPSVSGVTGIKSTVAIKAITEAVRPECVIVVDSLVCHEIERLGRSFQVTDTGIQPGSGITRDNERLDRGFLGCPVVAVGVPLVSVMNSHYVVPKTIDAVVARCAVIISGAILFAGKFSKDS